MKNKLSKSIIDNKVASPWTGVKKQMTMAMIDAVVFIFTFIYQLHNQNLGIWCMKPHDTKHPEISGAPFPLALYDGGLNVILFFWKILEWGTEYTRLFVLPQVCSSLRYVITTSVGSNA